MLCHSITTDKQSNNNNKKVYISNARITKQNQIPKSVKNDESFEFSVWTFFGAFCPSGWKQQSGGVPWTRGNYLWGWIQVRTLGKQPQDNLRFLHKQIINSNNLKMDPKFWKICAIEPREKLGLRMKTWIEDTVIPQPTTQMSKSFI